MSLQKRLYTASEVAHILGVSERTVKELIELGTLKSVQIKTNARASRGCRRVTQAQLDTYIAKLEVEARC